MRRFWLSLGLLFGVGTSSVQAQAWWEFAWDPEEMGTPTFPEWVKLQQRRSLDYLFKNISAPDTAPGSVIASPSQANPNYFYHWVRDAALVMDVVIRIFQSTQEGSVKQKLFNQVHHYILFSRKLQLTPNLSQGLGEPKFYADGRAYNEPWGRPQNDGPALRAISLIRFAQHMLKIGQEDYVRQYIYDSLRPSESLVKSDLDFVAAHWRQKSFDLWEEVLGDHFFTMLVQRRALIEGAQLADRLGDEESAEVYRAQAKLLSVEVEKFWSPERGYILATRNAIRGPIKSGLDSAVVLASLLAQGQDDFFGPSDSRVLATAAKLITVFHNFYPINFERDISGTAIGRYLEDTYDGVNTGTQGNAWFLTTEAMAELTYYALRIFRYRGVVKVDDLNARFFKLVIPHEDLHPGTEIRREDILWDDLMGSLMRFGDNFLGRVAYHCDRKTGQMSEQFHRGTGVMQGAHDLGWSYAGFLTASWTRKVVAPQ